MTETDEKRLNDAHCHFFSAGFFDALARDPAAPPAADPAVDSAGRARLGPAGESRATGRPLGRRARPPRRAARRPHGQRSRRRGVRRRGRGRAASLARFAGLFMVNPTAPGAEEGVRRGFGEDGLRCACLFPAMHRFALDDERVTAVFRARGRPRPRRLRPLRRVVGRRPPQARPRVALRRPARRSPGGRAGRVRFPRRPGDRPALRGRLLPRDADGRRPRGKHPRRYVELERLDEVHARLEPDRRVPPDAGGAGTAAHPFPDRTRRSFREAGSGRFTRPSAPCWTRSTSMRKAARRSSPTTSTACSDHHRNLVAADRLTPAGRADKAQAVGGSAPPGAIPSAMQPGRAGRSRSEPVRW